MFIPQLNIEVSRCKIVGDGYLLVLFSLKGERKHSINMTKPKHKTELNSIQKTIMQFINEIPGIRYRELLRITGISNGALSYNLNILHNSGRVRVDKVNDRVTRYFSSNISTLESNLIGFLRQNTARRIILYILEYGPCHFNEIINFTNKAPSTISWHLSRLRDSNIIKVGSQNGFHYYDIKINKSKLGKVIKKYKNSLQKTH